MVVTRIRHDRQHGRAFDRLDGSSQNASRGRQICALQHPAARNGLCNRSLVLTSARNVPQVSDSDLDREKQIDVRIVVGPGECMTSPIGQPRPDKFGDGAIDRLALS
jgi:hypothetical protein